MTEASKNKPSKRLEGIELIEHQARVKRLKRLWGQPKRAGERWELLDFIKQADITLGVPITLNDYWVQVALRDAATANDWDFLWCLARWYKEERKPAKLDPLSVFMWENWVKCKGAKDGWKGLRELDDEGIARFVKQRGVPIKGRAGSNEGETMVRDRRLDLNLKRESEPRFTYRFENGKLTPKKLMVLS